MLRECEQSAKITVSIHPHMLKRTFATQTYKCTKDIELVKTLMEHSNISITNRYVNTDLDSMKYKYSSAM